jgi:hypothetical protein
MEFQPPKALQDPSDDRALELLRRYFGDPPGSAGAAVGSAFDTWDSTGTRAIDVDRFTADDLVAITFLSVQVPPKAAKALLRDRAAEFAGYLIELGPDRDLVDEPDPLADDWVGWHLMQELRQLDGIGTTIASKLLARKRPRLRPIWDTVVASVTETRQRQWEPVRVALRDDNGALHDRLLRLREAARLPPQVSALRVLDVISWREGKDGGR